MTAVLRLSPFVFCLPKLAHRANQCYHTLYIPSAFPSKVLGVGCWVLGFATPPAQHPTPNTRAESALGVRCRYTGLAKNKTSRENRFSIVTSLVVSLTTTIEVALTPTQKEGHGEKTPGRCPDR